ncbi:MAG: DUF4252 domain-containing protein [Acidobacteria bacterium]|nr:DUF4252 domain-containing protein [Acidobacteriota bacterium]
MKGMTRIAWMVVLVASTLMTAAKAQTNAPVKDDLFSGTKVFEKGARDVTEITMDPDTLAMVGGKDGRRAHNMVLNVVRTYSYDKPGMYNMADVDAIRNRLNTGDWHCSVHTRDLKTGQSTDICSKRRSDDLSETAIITVEPKELTFIHTIRKGYGGESYLSGLPMMLSAPGASLAMIDPQAFVDMHVAMARMKGMDMGATQAQIASAMKNVPQIDSAAIKQRVDEQMRRLDEQMRSGRMQLKEEQPAPPAAPAAPAPPAAQPE